MSLDFFNEGIKKDASPQFSNEQNLFLEGKLPFLDPKRTNSIPIGTALDFLKFSGLRPDRIQKILKNFAKKTITYEEMKKIFRGVALAQNDIQPSAINIAANIKTKLPIFYDEDSEEEAGEQSKPVKQPPPTSQHTANPPVQNPPVQKTQEVKAQQDKLNFFQGVFPPPSSRPSQTMEKSNFAQFPPMHPSNHLVQSQTQSQPQPQSQSQPQKGPQQNELANRVKQFEVKWKKLKTEGNKIDGGQVKTLCKKLSDRTILSRAWKLCCLSNPGSLTKGQFFIFLQMISNNKIPDHLSTEMKAIIQEIDKQTNQASKPVQKVQNQASTPKASTPQPTSFTNLGSSQLFQNFTKIQPKPAEVVRNPKQEQNVQKLRNKMVQGRKQIQTTHSSQLTELRRGQQTMNNLMCEVEQYITAVDSRSNNWTTQIQELKQGQLLLNDRLNKVCMGMNTVIMKQHALIEDLVSNLATQNAINNQRVNVLENHINQIQEQLEVRQQQLAQFLKQKNSQKVVQVEKKVQPKPQVIEPFASPQSQKAEENHQEVHHIRESIAQAPSQGQKHQDKHEEQHSPQPIQRAVSQEKDEDYEYEQRIKSKRSQVLQLIMYLTPLTQEEMPPLIQRISEYSEEQLNMVYINCYQKLQARQQMQAQRAAQMRAADDEFSTSNFKGEVAPTQNMFQ